VLSLPAWLLWAGAIAGELSESVLRRPATLNLERVRQFVRPYWTASDARARRELGFESRYDLIRGMEDTIRWYRSVGWI
jgi:nucleoside-diphosphate-sugar epimerase